MSDATGFVMREPDGPTVPLVVSIPHCGIEVPPQIAAQFASEDIAALPMTDWHLHHLYDFLPSLGVTTIHARYSRLVVDLNRDPRSQPLYPGRFETGIVPKETFDGRPVFRTFPGDPEIRDRCLRYHRPYHQRLDALLRAHARAFGKVTLVDAHSVASAANLIHGELAGEIYLGDRDGTSCPASLSDRLEGEFRRRGFRVVRNAPFKGGYITHYYGRRPEVEAIQIEMCQRLYMNEQQPATLPATERFESMKYALKDVFVALVAALPRRSRGR